MIGRVRRSLLLAAALLGLLGACAQITSSEKRAIQGPTAEEVWTATVVLTTGRAPGLDEKTQWDNQIDMRISQYLADHPEIANSLDVQTFRYHRQVIVGMSKEQVLLLIGAPTLTARDAGEIEKLARQYWPGVKPNNPTEAWLYPQGWRLFFYDARLVDITQYLER
jgi:hypothetical protein